MSGLSRRGLATLVLAGAIGLEGAVGRALAGQPGVRTATREELEEAARKKREERDNREAVQRWSLEGHMAKLRRGDNNPMGLAALRRRRQRGESL